jgi:hypothetical protein
MANVTTIDISVEDPGEYAFDRLYDKLKDLGSDGVTSSNITGIVLSLMQFVQTIGGLNGAQKKQLVISVIRKFINEEIEDRDLARDLSVFVELTLPPLIDEFVALNNRETRIKIKSCISKILQKCFCCKLTN